MDPRLTEQRNPRSRRIDQLSTIEIVDLINAEDRMVAVAVGEEREAIAGSKALRREVIMVDDVPPDFGRENTQPARAMPADATRRTA